jgi:hypothetical protein
MFLRAVLGDRMLSEFSVAACWKLANELISKADKRRREGGAAQAK